MVTVPRRRDERLPVAPLPAGPGVAPTPKIGVGEEKLFEQARENIRETAALFAEEKRKAQVTSLSEFRTRLTDGQTKVIRNTRNRTLGEARGADVDAMNDFTAIFEDSTDIYRARQLVAERLARVAERIPTEYGRPVMGPLTTGLGEVYQFTLKGPGYSLMALRTLLEWDVGMRLRAVPGVVEVNIWGGEPKQFQVVVDPAKLLSFKLSLRQVFEALEQNNAIAGGGYIERQREQLLIRGEALATQATDLARIVVAHGSGGVPIYVADVATVQ